MEKEKKLEICKNWNYKYPSNGKILISDTLADDLKVKVNDTIILSFKDIFSISGASCKFGSTSNNYIAIIEMTTFFQDVAEIHQKIAEMRIRDNELSFAEIEAYPLMFKLQTDKKYYEDVNDVVFNLPGPRSSWYLGQSFDKIAKDVIQWSSKSHDVLKEFKENSTMASFLNLTFTIIVQGISYSLPGTALAFITAQVLIIYFQPLIETTLKHSITPILSFKAVLCGIGLGLCVPIIASYFPIRKALSSNIRDSLDRRHNLNGYIITVENKFYKTIKANKTLLCYFLPASLISMNIANVLTILFAVLLCMLFGMITLSLNLQPIVERIVLYIVFFINFWEKKGISILTKKNLLSHRLKNKKTALMFAMSITCIIFLQSVSDVELNTMEYNARAKIGADARIYIQNIYNTGSFWLQLKAAEEYLSSIPEVNDWAYLSDHFVYKNKNISDIKISNIGRVDPYRTHIRAISPNFFDVVSTSFGKTKFLYPTNEMTNQLTSIQTEQLYSYEGDNQSAPLVDMSKVMASGLSSLVSFPGMYELGKEFYTSMKDIILQYMIISYNANITKEIKKKIKSQMLTVFNMRVNVETLDDELEFTEDVRTILNYAFSVITVAFSLIAFFSLSNIMYMNIMEQKQEIGILRSLGVNRFSLIKIYIYEGFTILMSAGILGIIVGYILGITIMKQRTEFIHIPLSFSFPYILILVVVGCCIVSAILATIGPLLSLSKQSQIIKLLKE
ncbi:FtsX-domain-containing protein [Piromyces finnis]|uniref:FtsX-domain-containing protein n=1 Tax=Piromyces finnis TaxID=1754191 RepID=A0A1Y1UDR6_9FUNG|nr:FtsX-domain-containing protein [Piromyces finnis]|eukprot:ORX36181.1 FtsX-domain-containing protein [Piromyces finnis]